jgi:hypothetical protein
MGELGGRSSAAAQKGGRRARPVCLLPAVAECYVANSPFLFMEKQMQSPDLNRRQFTKLAGAVIGGLVAGLSTGLARADDKDEPKKKDPKKNLLLQEPHICRGLNPTCKGEVKGKKNDCAGQAYGPTVKDHACKGHNDCAGTGGCGEHPGENACKGQGECAVPLKAKAWAKARKNFEAAMKKAKKKFGPAPKKAS